MKIILVQPAGIFYVVKYSFYLVIFAADNNKLLNPNLFDVCYKNQYPRYKFLEGIIHHKNTPTSQINPFTPGCDRREISPNTADMSLSREVIR